MDLSSSNSFPSVSDEQALHDKISARAIAIWKAYDCPSNRDEEIWFEAERQLAAEAASALRASSGSASPLPGAAPSKETDISGTAKAASAPRAGKRRSA